MRSAYNYHQLLEGTKGEMSILSENCTSYIRELPGYYCRKDGKDERGNQHHSPQDTGSGREVAMVAMSHVAHTSKPSYE